jgi:hypothetical protein
MIVMKMLSAFKICRMMGILLILLPDFCYSQSLSNPVICTGFVYDKFSQKPLMGASITFTNTNINKNVGNTSSGTDGSFSFSMPSLFNFKVLVKLDGYKNVETNFTKEDLKRYERQLPAFYMDTVISIKIPPNVPVRQSKEAFVADQLVSHDIMPLPAAYDLLVYLNPDLRNRDSLMSNDKIILPKMPVLSNSIKRGNKKQFQNDKSMNRDLQNKLRDSLDKVSRLLGDDLSRYKIKYEEGISAKLKQMREYMRMDLQGFRERISKTTQLKAEGIIELLTKISDSQERLIATRKLNEKNYHYILLLWEDLSYLLKTNRYLLFTDNRNIQNEWAIESENAGHPLLSGPSAVEDAFEIVQPVTLYADKEVKESVASEDEVAVFGFIVWSPEITSNTLPNLSQPESRYVIRYFKPAFAEDKNAYKLCSNNANVAIANLNRAKYGVEVYDTKEKKFVETIYPFFSTDEAFSNRRYDSWLVPDFKEIKYILIRLK